MRKSSLPSFSLFTVLGGFFSLFAVGTAWAAPAAPRPTTPPSRIASPRARPTPATPRVAPRPRPVFDSTTRLVVSDEPPPPPPPPPRTPATPAGPPGTTPSPPAVRWGYSGAFSRRSTTLYLRDQPDGKPTFQLRIGLLLSVQKPGPKWTQVETSGLIRVSGWVPTPVLGLRVQKNTRLYGAPGGKSIGDVAMGQLVHIVRTQGDHALVRLMGYLPLEVWLKWEDLGTGATSYGRLQGRYPGGSSMVISAGPIHAATDGPKVGDIQDEGRIYRVRVAGRWSQVAMYDYSRVELLFWVPTARLRWGGYPWYGTGYYTTNCEVGQQGSLVALAEFRAYAAKDDAWPNIRILSGARFNLAQAGDGWMQLSSSGCISFSAFVENRPGDWAPSHLRLPGRPTP